MLRLIIGFLFGVYVGSEYDISPAVKQAKTMLTEMFPKK